MDYRVKAGLLTGGVFLLAFVVMWLIYNFAQIMLIVLSIVAFVIIVGVVYWLVLESLKPEDPSPH